MRRRISLYIDGSLTDLSDESFILLNYAYEDLSNPVVVKNSYSQSISLPATPANNRIFGSIYRSDRKTMISSVSQSGVSFDVRKKTPFSIYADTGEVLESGYCKMEKIVDENGMVSYDLVLFGGLGSFFFGLAYKEDGGVRTLADLAYKDKDDRQTTSFSIQCNNQDVADAWDSLEGVQETTYSFWNIINFCPAYNGLPADFDAKHAIISTNFDNVAASQTKDGVTYGYKTGVSGALCTFTNDHTEWEMSDLRWYLQRPCISMRAIFDAICDPSNNGGYTVNLDSSFFNSDNHLYWDAWMTLSMIDTADRNNPDCINNVLKRSKSPADYLFSYAKMFGLVFVWDTATKKVDILSRQTFFSKYLEEGAIDLSDRVDMQGKSIVPVMADAHFYQMGGESIGEAAEQYRNTYGEDYGIAVIDTGCEFDNDIKVLTEGIVFRDGTEAQERNLMFTSWGAQPDGQGGWETYFQLPRYEQVTYQLWDDTDEKSENFDILCPVPSVYMDSLDQDYSDWLPKLQLHGADEKEEDGSDMLCVFEGMRDAPLYATSPANYGKEYYLTNDTPAMADLLGMPCWDLTFTGIARTALPSFRRHHLEGNIIVESFEWGKPLVRPVLNDDYPAGEDVSIYSRFWAAYLSDRYDVDGKAMVVKMNHEGLQVGQDLLRRFFWYGGVHWVINRIINHSLTTNDLTEVEIVKVKDIDAYVMGAYRPETEYLTVSPSTLSQGIVAEGGTAVFTISSSSEWRMTEWDSRLTYNRQMGSTGVTRLECTWGANPDSGMRTATVTIENLDGIERVLTIVQAGSSIVDTREIAFIQASQSLPKTAGTFTADIECTSGMTAAEVEVTSNVGWLTGLTVSLVDSTTLRVTGNISANTDVERTGVLTAIITGTNKTSQHSVVQAQGLVTSWYTIPDGVTEIPYTASTQNIEIGATLSWRMSISSDETGGAYLLDNSGDAGIHYVGLVVPKNNTSSVRTIRISVRHGSATRYITFKQAASGTASKYITPSNPSVSIGAKANLSVVDIVNASHAWEVADKPVWLNATAPSYASGSRTMTITTLQPNYSQNVRIGIITLRLLIDTSVVATIAVTQAAAYVQPQISTATLAKSGTAYSIPVTSSSAWQVVSTSQSWLTAVKDGNNLVLSATVNTTGSLRNASVTLALSNDPLCTATVNVSQLTMDGPADDDIEVGVSTLNFPPEGGSHDVMVYATGPWTVALPVWITATYTTQTGSQAGERVTLTASANVGLEDRSHTLVFTLTGKGKSATIAATQDAVPSLVLDETDVEADYKSQSLEVHFVSNTQWKVQSSTGGMLTPPAVSSGTGDATLNFNLSMNISTEDRQGEIVIAYGQNYASTAIVRVLQRAATLSLSSSSGLFSGDGETKFITLTADGPWEVVNKPSWATVSANTQSGTTLVYIIAAANSITQLRAGVITFRISGTQVEKTYTMQQLAATPFLTISEDEWNVDYHAQSGSFTISSNTDWEIVSKIGGVTFNLERGSGATNNAWNIPRNTSAEFTKEYSAVIQTADGTIQRSISITQGESPFIPPEEE